MSGAPPSDKKDMPNGRKAGAFAARVAKAASSADGKAPADDDEAKLIADGAEKSKQTTQPLSKKIKTGPKGSGGLTGGAEFGGTLVTSPGKSVVWMSAAFLIGVMSSRLIAACSSANKYDRVMINPLLILIFDLCAFHALISMNMEKDDIRNIRGLHNRVVDLPSGVGAKLKVAAGYLKLSNINSFVSKMCGGMEFTDSTKVFAANCGFQEAPDDTQPGAPLDPANMAGRCSLLDPAVLTLILAGYAENLASDVSLNSALSLCYGVVNDGLRRLYSGLRECYEMTMTSGSVAVTEAALNNFNVETAFNALTSNSDTFNFGPVTFSTIRDAVYSRLQSDHGNHGVRFIDYERIMPTLDPSCLIAREADHQMYAIAGGTEILLRAASVLPAQMAAVSTLGANLRVRGLDLGFIDTNGLDATSPMQSDGYLQFESQISGGVTAKIRDFHRRDAIDVAKRVNKEAYESGTIVT